MKKISCFFIAIVLFSYSFSQTRQSTNGWHLLDQQKDGYLGISLNQAYELLKGRKSTTIIVAVIDSGIDTLQEDLKGILWSNPKEISGNGKDDDGNGYVDDIHGWNFCGAPDGENMVRNSLEVPRVYHTWKGEFEAKKEKDIPSDKKFLFTQWQKASSIIEQEYKDASKELPQVANFLTALENTSKIICEELSVKEFGPAQLKTFSGSNNSSIKNYAEIWTNLFSQTTDTSVKNTAVLKEVTEYKIQLDDKISRKLEMPQDWRTPLVKDNYTDIRDRSYGNNNLKMGSGDHGTLVSGVIAAMRNNAIGVDGIADNVQIMAVRAVPGGDEHDKDVALAIRYAVDNGARIINMSFGKPVSPYKQFVDDAVRYAASKGVLLVHGSGNDGKDISKDVFYPNPMFVDGSRATNFLTVGASGDENLGGYAASFSNYSSKWVDVFAPGVAIYSTATDNRYVSADGTSLACPVVTGVAALLKSYFPKLAPEQIIQIITTSGVAVDKEVQAPGNDRKMVKFSDLSSSGKIVNAYQAVKLALSLEK